MKETENKSPYLMKIRRTIVDDLGLKLYDKVSAVVAEIIANSYDADAEEVVVKLPLGKTLASKKTKENYTIEVSDNGHGMTPSEADEFYLTVGKHRRDDKMQGNYSRRKNRPVMGRKGLGKLAPFGVCKTIEIRSAGGRKTDKGFQVAHFLLDYDAMTSDDGAKEKDYRPKPLSDDKEWDKKSGTTIKLKDFLPKRVPDIDTFSRQLSSRFGLGKPDFKIRVVDNKDENPEKEFYIHQVKIETMEGTKIEAKEMPPFTLNGKEYHVEGWIGMAKESYKNEEFAGVRIYVREKLAAVTRDFGIPTGFPGEFVARSYLVGKIHADWLDENEDLIQTHRQDILWSSELGQAFSEWGKERIKEVAKAGREPKRKLVRERFFKASKLEEKAKKRFRDPELRSTVSDLGKRIGGFASEDEVKDYDYVNDLAEIILTVSPHKFLVDAFRRIEKLAVNGKVDLNELIKILKSTKIAELASYGQIAYEKIKSIDLLEQNIRRDDALERDFQEILENAPWLINPLWDPLSNNQSLKNFRSSFESWYEKEYGETIKTTTDMLDPNKRPDFIFIHRDNALQIVEIKPPNHTFNIKDWNRMIRYPSAVKKFLEENPKLKNDFLGGVVTTLITDKINITDETTNDAIEHRKQNRELVCKTWKELLNDTKKAHESFIKASEPF